MSASIALDANSLNVESEFGLCKVYGDVPTALPVGALALGIDCVVTIARCEEQYRESIRLISADPCCALDRDHGSV